MELPTILECLIGFLIVGIIDLIHWNVTIGSSRRALIQKHGCKPPKRTAELNAFPWSIVGLKVFREATAALKSHGLVEMYRNRFRRNGNTLHYKMLFSNIVSTIEPENLKAMMATNFKDWGIGDRRKGATVPLLGHGIFTTDGQAWHASRELLRPNFARVELADLSSLLTTHADRLIAAIPRDGSTVNLRDLFYDLTMDASTQLLFGRSTNLLKPGTDEEGKKGKRFAEAFNRAQERSAEYFRLGAFAKVLHPVRYLQFLEDVKCCHEFVADMAGAALERQAKIEQGEKDVGAAVEGNNSTNVERYVFLYELLKVTKDIVRIRSETLNVLMAGRDSTASTLSNVWFVLARRPDIWQKLKVEVDALGGEKPTFDQVKRMKYLRMVLDETLRLYPIVATNARAALVDTVLPRGGGPDGRDPLFIPKGQMVTWSLYALQRREDLFGLDAAAFRPERWEVVGDEKEKLMRWAYLPFGAGGRNCLGQQFALTEAGYVTVRLMQEFERIEPRDDMEWTEYHTLTMAILQGTIVSMVPK